MANSPWMRLWELREPGPQALRDPAPPASNLRASATMTWSRAIMGAWLASAVTRQPMACRWSRPRRLRLAHDPYAEAGPDARSKPAAARTNASGTRSIDQRPMCSSIDGHSTTVPDGLIEYSARSAVDAATRRRDQLTGAEMARPSERLNSMRSSSTATAVIRIGVTSSCPGMFGATGRSRPQRCAPR